MSLLNLSTSNTQKSYKKDTNQIKVGKQIFNTLERCYFGFYGGGEQNNLTNMTAHISVKIFVTLNM